MPNYTYRCQTCEHMWDASYPIADRKVPESNPCPMCFNTTIEHMISAPFVGDAVRQGRKPASLDAGWRETLSRIKHHHPKSTIDIDRY